MQTEGANNVNIFGIDKRNVRALTSFRFESMQTKRTSTSARVVWHRVVVYVRLRNGFIARNSFISTETLHIPLPPHTHSKIGITVCKMRSCGCVENSVDEICLFYSCAWNIPKIQCLNRLESIWWKCRRRERETSSQFSNGFTQTYTIANNKLKL